MTFCRYVIYTYVKLHRKRNRVTMNDLTNHNSALFLAIRALFCLEFWHMNQKLLS